MPNAGLDEAQAGIKIARRNLNNLGYVGDTILLSLQKAATVDTGNLGELSKKTIILGYNFRQKEKNN